MFERSTVTAQLAQPSGCSGCRSRPQHMAVRIYFISPLTLQSGSPLSPSPLSILMSNKDYYGHGQPQQQQQYYPPQGATFSTRCYCSCVIDESVCHQGHRLVKVTTLSSLSSRTRAMVVSLAINRSLSLKRFMCTPKVPTRGAGIPTHAELYHVVSSLRPRRTVTSARRAWQVSACVVVRKVRGFAVTSLPYYVLTRLAPTCLQKYAHVFSERVLPLAE